MKTFFIFKLNKEYYILSKTKPYNIYLLLNTIYKHNKKDIITAFNLFNEVCSPINKGFYNKYIYDKLHNIEEYTKFKNIHMYNNYFTNETSKMEINKSYIRIKSNISNNIFINNLIIIDSLFICEFNNNYYKLNKKIII